MQLYRELIGDYNWNTYQTARLNTIESIGAILASVEEMQINNRRTPVGMHAKLINMLFLKKNTITIKVFWYDNHSNMVHGNCLKINVRDGLTKLKFALKE